MVHQPYSLDRACREIVLTAIREVCRYRGWTRLAAHVRSNHVHVVADITSHPDHAVRDFKSYASRKLNAVGIDPLEGKRWSRGESARRLPLPEARETAIHYVVAKQGEPISVYVAGAASERTP